MKVEHGPDGTLGEDVIIAWLRDELEPSDRAAVGDHIASCEACGEACAERTARERRTIPAGPLRPRTPRLLRAAGWVLALVAVGALATTPVRGWIAERIGGLRSDELVIAEIPAAPGRGAELRFRPGGETVAVQVQTAQVRGRLLVTFGGADAASVSVSGGGTEHLTVTEEGLHIANFVGAEISYVLTLPGPVDRAIVQVGARDPVVVERGDAASVSSVDLSTGRLSKPEPDGDP